MFSWRKKKRRNNSIDPKRLLWRQIGVGVGIATVLGLLATGIWYGSRIESLTISEVSVVGGETIDHELLVTIVNEELDGTYYRLVPKRFAWLYPEQRITKRLLDVDRVKQVLLERDHKNLTVVFEEYRPFALWCTALEGSECLFLDRFGYAFAPAPKLEGAAFLRFSERNREPAVDTEAFDRDFLERTVAFRLDAYDQVGLNIIHVEKTVDDEVTYHIAGGGTLKTTLRMGTEETLENLETILSSEQFSHLVPGNFQYIDLRYGNKIFVNEEPVLEVVATGTATSS